jgi:hypothetical protein
MHMLQVMSRKVNATYTAEQVKGAFRIFEGASPSGCVKADGLIRYDYSTVTLFFISCYFLQGFVYLRSREAHSRTSIRPC